MPVTPCNATERCHVITIRHLSHVMTKAHCRASWRQIGASYGITGGMAFRIATQGYEPKSPIIRARLGLPAMVPVSACPKCGGVHVKLRCDAGRVVRRELVEPLVGVIL